MVSSKVEMDETKMKTLLRTLLLTLLLVAGCEPDFGTQPDGNSSDVVLAPDSGDSGDSEASTRGDSCVSPVSQVLFPIGFDGRLEVTQGVDAQGFQYQTGVIYLATDRYIVNTGSDAGPWGLELTINGQRQGSTVHNGRAIGLGQPRSVEANSLIHPFCPGAMSFWRVEVGFGTIATEIPASEGNFSVVGRQLTEGQELTITFNVCSARSCNPGTPARVQVHIQ